MEDDILTTDHHHPGHQELEDFSWRHEAQNVPLDCKDVDLGRNESFLHLGGSREIKLFVWRGKSCNSQLLERLFFITDSPNQDQAASRGR